MKGAQSAQITNPCAQRGFLDKYSYRYTIYEWCWSAYLTKRSAKDKREKYLLEIDIVSLAQLTVLIPIACWVNFRKETWRLKNTAWL